MVTAYNYTVIGFHEITDGQSEFHLASFRTIYRHNCLGMEVHVVFHNHLTLFDINANSLHKKEHRINTVNS